jgi:serine/threonine-protein kinase
VARFRREPSIIARLAHPHIVQVIDCGEDGSDLWYAMEFLRGGTLLDRIRLEGRVSPHEVRACFRAMAGALGEAFHHGVIHRDVKPGNIFNAGPKLADFGMAKSPDRGEEGAPGMSTPRAALVGTPFYVAPERAAFQSGDHRSDIYSLGATLYHAATGGLLFDLQTADRAAWYRCHLHTQPRPVREIVPDFPDDLAAVIHRCLEKDPGRRFPTFEALAEAL